MGRLAQGRDEGGDGAIFGSGDEGGSPVTDLIDADFTFLNEKLARWYWHRGVTGN
jgi:hypothetical protein